MLSLEIKESLSLNVYIYISSVIVSEDFLAYGPTE